MILPAMIGYLVIAVLFSYGSTENALTALNITEETVRAALPSVRAAAGVDGTMMGCRVSERLMAMLLHIGLTVIVYYGVRNKKKACLPAAIILHMLMDTFPALYQRGIVPIWAAEIWAALWAAAVVCIAVKLYAKMNKSETMERAL